MKRILLSLYLLVFTIGLFAQKQFEGKVVYGITYENLPAGMEAMASMLPSEIKIYIKDNMSRTEQSMGMAGNQIVISDNKTETGTMLMDMMGQKYFVKMDNNSTKNAKSAAEPKYNYLTETKEIAGYKCKKAEVTMEGIDESFSVFYTEDIPYGSNKQFKGLKGFPLEYEIAANGLNMHVSAKQIANEKVPDAFFKIPDGYQEMSQEDLMKMMGGN
jgi:GLPGLI family protein